MKKLEHFKSQELWWTIGTAMQLFPFLNKIKHQVSAQGLRGGKCYDPNFKIINREQENIYADYFFSALAIFLYFIFFFWSGRMRSLLVQKWVLPQHTAHISLPQFFCIAFCCSLRITDTLFTPEHAKDKIKRVRKGVCRAKTWKSESTAQVSCCTSGCAALAIANRALSC